MKSTLFYIFLKSSVMEKVALGLKQFWRFTAVINTTINVRDIVCNSEKNMQGSALRKKDEELGNVRKF